jgi:uncharacterized protein YndB with AHSA1/START domain
MNKYSTICLPIRSQQRKAKEPLPSPGSDHRRTCPWHHTSRKEQHMEFPPFQSRQEIVIHAPLQIVWDFHQDLTNIAVYHPRVKRVDLISGKNQRGNGVAYRCHLTDGKHTCVEKYIEVVPMERIVTALPKDTMGITKLQPDYLVEARLTPVASHETKVEFHHYYSTKSFKTKFFNVIAKRKIARDAQNTLEAMKRTIEQHASSSFEKKKEHAAYDQDA